jgi:hypothetical protein
MPITAMTYDSRDTTQALASRLGQVLAALDRTGLSNQAAFEPFPCSSSSVDLLVGINHSTERQVSNEAGTGTMDQWYMEAC